MVEISDIRSLQQNNYKKVRISMENEKPDLNLPGVTNLQVEHDTLQFFFKGDINLILSRLSEFRVKDVTIEEPTLEEIFMHYYE